MSGTSGRRWGGCPTRSSTAPRCCPGGPAGTSWHTWPATPTRWSTCSPGRAPGSRHRCTPRRRPARPGSRSSRRCRPTSSGPRCSPRPPGWSTRCGRRRTEHGRPRSTTGTGPRCRPPTCRRCGPGRSGCTRSTSPPAWDSRTCPPTCSPRSSTTCSGSGTPATRCPTWSSSPATGSGGPAAGGQRVAGRRRRLAHRPVGRRRPAGRWRAPLAPGLALRGVVSAR